MTSFTDADRRKILESLTADELDTFKEAFTVFDKNQDGTITTKVRVDIDPCTANIRNGNYFRKASA